jgi:hypothetical protein
MPLRCGAKHSSLDVRIHATKAEAEDKSRTLEDASETIWKRIALSLLPTLMAGKVDAKLPAKIHGERQNVYHRRIDAVAPPKSLSK